MFPSKVDPHHTLSSSNYANLCDQLDGVQPGSQQDINNPVCHGDMSQKAIKQILLMQLSQIQDMRRRLVLEILNPQT